MITLERVRLVNWHNFLDFTIEIGNRCLLAGDNGSGKSTVIDAIQYALAANLRMAKFNSAAEERKSGGRDLMGYVRCKVGSEATEYRRGDTISHVMLEWSMDKEANFSCGVCIEAWKDNHYTEHFWTASGLPVKNIKIVSDNGETLSFRQFKNMFDEVNGINIIFYESKQRYVKELTNKLGVYRRQQEINPYLDALTRSIGFKPLASIDQFVCDYILDDNPVSIQDMKQNLENYREADRQAKAADAKIKVLKKICAKADEWRHNDELILKQEYLKLRIEQEKEKQRKENLSRQLEETKNKIEFTEKKISFLNQKWLDTEHELRAIDQSLAANDSHRLYEEIRLRLERIEIDLVTEKENSVRYKELKKQCETLLARELKEDFEEENAVLCKEADKYNEIKHNAKQKKTAIDTQLRDTRSELADLERGIQRYPDAPRELRAALEKEGIDAHFLAEAAEINDPAWADAIEGFLNTRRFSILVNPADFQRAMEIYNGLPRSVAGAFIPNIEKMRNAVAKPGSLAEIVSAKGYAVNYINYTLGKVMRADLAGLKEYDSAVTKDCMTYMNHTAGRINQEAYKRHYLGSGALEKRRKFLAAEEVRLNKELAAAEREERQAYEHEDCLNRVIRSLPKLESLFPSVEKSKILQNDFTQTKIELDKIDTQSFKELEEKRKDIEKQLTEFKENNNKLQNEIGDLRRMLSTCTDDLEVSSRLQEEKEEAIANFGKEHPLMLGDCETFALEKFSRNSIEELSGSYETTLKRHKTHAETLKKEYNVLVRDYESEFHFLLGMEPSDNKVAEELLKRLETSELPEYREKIAKEYSNAEKEFKEHFISRLNERIEEARESFDEINEILRTLLFGRDQYRFVLDELDERKGLIEVIRNTAKIPSMDDGGLFTQIEDPAEKKAAEDLFDRILNSPLDSQALKDICDYRSYFHYDITITETDTLDEKGSPVKLSLSRVLKEKSGGESQTPYYVAIAASFYRFYKSRPDSTVRLVIFDEAFNRMDDERIGKILSFYNNLNLQIITSVPPEKIDAILPYMERINIISRYGGAIKVRECRIDKTNLKDIKLIDMEAK